MRWLVLFMTLIAGPVHAGLCNGATPAQVMQYDYLAGFTCDTLGTAATANIGTSGDTVPLLSGNNTLSGANAITGSLTAPTQPAGTNNTAVATTAFVKTSQFQAAQITTNAAGSAVWTYPAGCTSSSLFFASAIGNATTLLNVQNVGLPTGTTQTFQVNLANLSAVALLGLTILSIPASPGVTTINVFCK